MSRSATSDLSRRLEQKCGYDLSRSVVRHFCSSHSTLRQSALQRPLRAAVRHFCSSHEPQRARGVEEHFGGEYYRVAGGFLMTASVQPPRSRRHGKRPCGVRDTGRAAPARPLFGPPRNRNRSRNRTFVAPVPICGNIGGCMPSGSCTAFYFQSVWPG